MQTYVSNLTGTSINDLRKELAELVCMAQHLRHGTKPDCDDACAMCMDRRCKELVPHMTTTATDIHQT